MKRFALLTVGLVALAWGAAAHTAGKAAPPSGAARGSSRAVASAAKGVRESADPAKTHWAFQPVGNPPLPAVKNADWPTSPVDSFILAKLEANGMAPSAPTDKRTLIRRATFDLTGLPPAAAEVAAFEVDRSPGAFARVVDRLL